MDDLVCTVTLRAVTPQKAQTTLGFAVYHKS
jgi:hypothetical protein